MRKLILGEFISLDGFASDKNGTTAFFEGEHVAEGNDEDMVDFIKTVDTMLLGRKTYEMFLAYWPTDESKNEIIAEPLNNLKKTIVSSTLENAPWGNYSSGEIISGDAVEGVRNLKNQSGKDIVLWGSISLAQSLVDAGLVDEYHIRVVPVILGSGTPMFDKSSEIQLELAESKTYPSGLTFLKYLPK